MPGNSRPLVLLDKGAGHDDPQARIVHWAEMNVPTGHDSLPLLVESQARKLREEYLAWVHDLGEYTLKGRKLREHLAVDQEFSFWWLTSVAAKNALSSPAIYAVFKLRALEKLYLDSGCQGIILYSANRRLHLVLFSWCRKLGQPYKWERQGVSQEPRGLRERFRLLPPALRAGAYLGRLLWCRRRHLSSIRNIPAGDRQATVVTYFPNIDGRLAQQGIFRSNFWRELHDLIDQTWKVNWIWIYTQNDEYSFGDSLRLRQRFQEKAQGRAKHYFLEEFLTGRALVKALHLYTKLFWRRFSLRSVRHACHFPGSSLNFWPFMAKDWADSLAGPEALEGCVALMSFRSLVEQLPNQEWGLYLWENLPWERALIAAWEASKHGKLIGFQHATLRFLDLRFFEDPRSYGLEKAPPPIPTVLAVDGPGPRQLLSQVGFPQNRMSMVEAVRYMYLSKPVNSYQAVDRVQVNEPKEDHALLVITDNSSNATASQLQLLGRAAQKGGLKDYRKILVKPHPDCPVDEIIRKAAPNLQVEVVRKSLSRLWSQASVVYTSNATSASVEAVKMGLPVLVHVEEDNLNFSPLLGLPGVKHVGTVEELVKELSSIDHTPVRMDYFCLERGLSRWRNLLGT